MKEIFKKMITADFHEEKTHPVIPRDCRIPVDSGKVVSLIVETLERGNFHRASGQDNYL